MRHQRLQSGYKPGYVTKMTVRTWRRRSWSSVIYLRCLPPGIGRATLHTAGILGIATFKSCGTLCRHSARWALTPPSHPYPHIAGGYFLPRYYTVTGVFPKEVKRSMLPGLSSDRSHVGPRRNARLLLCPLTPMQSYKKYARGA